MSVTFEDWQDQAAALFDAFAEPCLVQRGALPVVSTRAVADDAVLNVGEYGRVLGAVRTRKFLKAEWSPQRGDIVTMRGSIGRVESIKSDDGIVVEAVLHG